MASSIFSKYPKPEQMIASLGDYDQEFLRVNAHIHTPYSFCAYTEIRQLFDMAHHEKVKILGINDFFTTDGFEEFTALAKSAIVFPLFNIEFVCLQKDLQAAGIYANDPISPGRTYISGKGLRYPVHFNAAMIERLFALQEERNQRAARVIEKLNVFLSDLGAGFSLSFDEIQNKYARNILCECHIVKALRHAVIEYFPDYGDQKKFFVQLFSGKEPKSSLDDFAGLENEIREYFMKPGGRAYVQEDDKALLSLNQVAELIIHAGGVPCYQVLLDNSKGEFADFERDIETLHRELVAKNICALELFPGRNNPEILEEFVNFFNEKGFVITFGTEHNTSRRDPVTVYGSDGDELSNAMKKIGYEGACVIAAHQYLRSKGKKGYLYKSGKAKLKKRSEFIALGNAVIKKFLTGK